MKKMSIGPIPAISYEISRANTVDVESGLV